MGMDYQFAGSASYPRFEEEMVALSKLLGATPYVKARDPFKDSKDLDDFVKGMFGTVYNTDAKKKKFLWPDETPQIIMKWFENPYDEFTVEETMTIAKWVFSHLTPEDIVKFNKEYSDQIFCELETCWECEEAWSIS